MKYLLNDNLLCGVGVSAHLVVAGGVINHLQLQLLEGGGEGPGLQGPPPAQHPAGLARVVSRGWRETDGVVDTGVHGLVQPHQGDVVDELPVVVIRVADLVDDSPLLQEQQTSQLSGKISLTYNGED